MTDTIDPSFLSGTNTAFIVELFEHYLDDPASVDVSWRNFFAGLRDDAGTLVAELRGPAWARQSSQRIIQGAIPGELPGAGKPPPAGVDARKASLDSIRALQLVRSYRVRGHLQATLDPLGLKQPEHHPELDPATYGFTEADYDRPIYVHGIVDAEEITLRELMDLLQRTYCGNIGVEYMHIQDSEEKAWIQTRIEQARNQTEFTERGKRAILERLTEAENFEKFLDKRFTGTKRFGLEGAETLVPALEQILKRGSQLGVKEFVLGMAHRGRLNVLANVIGKPYVAIFSEFQGVSANPEDVQGSGDVKYHLGTSADRVFDDATVHLSLAANPSHLEAVNPVVLGKVRAKQRQRDDDERSEVVGLLLHGDAAMAGQGLVPETFELSELKGYRTGGTVHVVINNQIGFTTTPAYGRSGIYCSDVARIVQAPIFHVNADDPEATLHVCRIAMEFRQQFKKDVVVDMVCYRRHGHNETDEPAFTQPLMYRRIAELPTTRTLYAERLIAEGTLTREESDAMVTRFFEQLDQAFESAKSYRPNKADWLEGAWAGFGRAPTGARKGDTAVPIEVLREVGKALCAVPDDFKANRKIVRQLQEKAQMFETGQGFDWGTCEALALGTLAIEGTRTRFSGQDVERGTFSHRHAVLFDQETEDPYVPLNHIRPDQAQVSIFDSPLSEAGVLGFDYGYSLADPQTLVIWEAQFGDFANGAQVIIDQFIASSEAKWLRMSGITLLLPHGYEGQGPEHSSARLERYLQLCAEDNLQVCNLSTPANYFHVLRRQIHRGFRKPLVIMAPKSMLRAKLSSLADMGPGTSFHRVIGDAGPLVPDDQVRRVVLCCGKIYHELLAQRVERRIDDVALVRVEQLYPFPADALAIELGRYVNADVVWCQEEPENMGAWYFIDRRIENVLAGLRGAATRPLYAGRREAAASATGSMKRHLKEQAELIDAALTVGAIQGKAAA